MYNWNYEDSFIAVNITISSVSNTFDSVIVEEHLFINFSGIYIVGTYYYAKNVGLVSVDNEIDSAVLILDNYFIKKLFIFNQLQFAENYNLLSWPSFVR